MLSKQEYYCVCDYMSVCIGTQKPLQNLKSFIRLFSTCTFYDQKKTKLCKPVKQGEDYPINT